MNDNSDGLWPLLLVTRVEVIGEGGRLLTLHNVCDVSFSQQDDGRTLKIFVSKEAK